MKETNTTTTISPALAGLAGGILGGVFIVLVAFFGQPSLFAEKGGEITVAALDVSDIVSEVNPAVVSLIITKDVPVIEEYYFQFPFGFGSPRYRQNGTRQEQVGGGSGFVVSEDGYVVTNAHVVSDELASYTVFFNDGASYEAEVVTIDEVIDIALLKIEAQNLPYLTFGDSEQIELGDPVIAIGNALGEFSNTVSTGVISGLSRSIVASGVATDPDVLENVIQTDAAINPGNSGGPLINLRGEVIGVNVAVVSGSENIGFSLPSNVVARSVDQMQAEGRVLHPYLGVRYVVLTPELAQAYELPVEEGVWVYDGSDRPPVLPNSPADQVGIQEGDIIVAINGEEVTAERSLAYMIYTHAIGEEITVTLVRNGETRDLRVVLEERPTE